MSKLDPVNSSESPPPPDHHSRGGGGFFTFLMAAAALAVGLYLVYDRTGFSSDSLDRFADDPSSASWGESYEDNGEFESSLTNNVGALEERLAKIEEANSRMEKNVEQIGREVGGTLGVSEQGSSIPLYLLRINLADMQLRLTGNPQLVLQDLRELLTFVPAEKSNLLASVQADIDRLQGTRSKDDLIGILDGLADALEGSLVQEEEELPKEGVLGAFLDIVNARRAQPPELEFLEAARTAAREARTLALVGDERNYLINLEAVEENVDLFRDKYDPALLSDIEKALGDLFAAGIPDYSLAAAKPI